MSTGCGRMIAGKLEMAMASPRALHPALKPIAFLLGKWRGEGEGGYPTISSLTYGEENQLFHAGKLREPNVGPTWEASELPTLREVSAGRPREMLLGAPSVLFDSLHGNTVSGTALQGAAAASTVGLLPSGAFSPTSRVSLPPAHQPSPFPLRHCRHAWQQGGNARGYSTSARGGTAAPAAAISASARAAQDIGRRARERQQGRLWSLAIGGVAVAGFAIAALNTFQENLMFYITPTQALERLKSEPSKNRLRLGGLVLEGSVRRFANTNETEFVITDLETDILVKYRGALPDLFREGHSIVAEGYLKPEGAPGTPSAPPQGVPGGGTVLGGASVAYSEAAPPHPPASPLGRPGPREWGAVSSEEAELGSVAEDVSKKARSTGLVFSAVEVLAKHDEKYMPREVAAVIAANKAKLEAQAELDSTAGALLSSGQSTGKQAQWAPGGQPQRGKQQKGAVSRAPLQSQAYEVPTT